MDEKLKGIDRGEGSTSINLREFQGKKKKINGK
jgi:hypothetical protein